MKNLLLRGLFPVVVAGSVFGGMDVRAQTAPAKAVQATPTPSPEKPREIEVPPTDVKSSQAIPSAEKKLPADASRPADSGEPMLPKARRSPYVIGPEDVLIIRVWDQPNLSGQVIVGPDGMISLQLIDEVRAEGLTPEQLKGVLTERLKEFIKNPDVNVQVQRVNSRKFIIQGEVSRPGSFSLTGPTTVIEALVSGGGFREFANLKKIYILRTELNPQTKKVETKKLNFNYKDVSHGKHMEQNILIQNGDQIFVP